MSIAKCWCLAQLFLVVYSKWSLRYPKVCDTKTLGIYPFTGFKFSRQYKLDGVSPNSMHFLTLSHCDHGKKDFTRTHRTRTSEIVDWDRPFCLLKPKARDLRKLNSAFGEIPSNDDTLREEDMSTSNGDILREKISNVKKNIKDGMKNKINDKLETVTEGKYIEYRSKKTSKHLQQMNDPLESMEYNSRHFVCYKMARRRKYAKRDLSFYMPQTFVGGLFECPLLNDQVKELKQNFTASDFLKSLNFKCDSFIAKPILPLIAEDSTKQWFQFRLKSMVQTIPFLTTATPFDPRFSLSNTPDMFLDTWASDIEVNEDYDFSESDLQLASNGIAMVADYLHRLFQPIDLNRLVSSSFRTSREHHLEDPNLTNRDYLTNKLEGLSFDQKVNLLFSSDYYQKTALLHLEKLEKLWDSITGF